MPPRSALPRPRLTQAERRCRAERSLVDAAIDLISRKGLAGLTMAEVGEAAGYSRGLVTHHYGSREAFVQVVAQSLRQRLVNADPAVTQTPGLDALLASVDLYLSGTGRTARAVNVLLHEAVVGGGALLESMRRFNAMSRRYFAQQIRVGIERGEMQPGLDPDAQAVIILGMLRGVVLQGQIDERMHKARMRADMVAAVRRMVAV